MSRFLLIAAAVATVGFVQTAEAQQRQHQQPRGISSSLAPPQGNRFAPGGAVAQPRPGQPPGGLSGAAGGRLISDNGLGFRR